jgi:hypothetical protein
MRSDAHIFNFKLFTNQVYDAQSQEVEDSHQRSSVIISGYFIHKQMCPHLLLLVLADLVGGGHIENFVLLLFTFLLPVEGQMIQFVFDCCYQKQ